MCPVMPLRRTVRTGAKAARLARRALLVRQGGSGPSRPRTGPCGICRGGVVPGRRACSAGRRRCRPRVGPGAGIGGIEHRRLCLIDGPGRVVQRVGRVVLRLLGVSLGRLRIAFVALAFDAPLQVGHLGRGVGLERLPLGVRVVSCLLGLAVNGLLRGLGLGLGRGHPRLDLLVRLVPGGVQRALQLSHLGLQRINLLGYGHVVPLPPALRPTLHRQVTRPHSQRLTARERPSTPAPAATPGAGSCRIAGNHPSPAGAAVRYEDSRRPRAARDSAVSRRILGANSRSRGPIPPCTATFLTTRTHPPATGSSTWSKTTVPNGSGHSLTQRRGSSTAMMVKEPPRLPRFLAQPPAPGWNGPSSRAISLLTSHSGQRWPRRPVASPRFAIGRSIWGQLIVGHNQGNTAAWQAAGQIASRYVDFPRWDCAASGVALASDAGPPRRSPVLDPGGPAAAGGRLSCALLPVTGRDPCWS